MIDSFYIAWKYLSFSKARTMVLVSCITLIAFLPMSLDLLLDQSEQQLLDRAKSTPLVAGAKGSALDLMMNTLYFDDEAPALVSMAARERFADTGLVTPIPIYARFRARGFPVVGVGVDYFGFRELNIAHGRGLAMLGEAVLGATVAEELGLSPGSSITSSPEAVFDLAGIYPLKMSVVGVLERSHSSDDLAVFVDLKTAWVIEGLGHGHQDLTKQTDPSVVIDRSEGKIVAGAKLVQYTEITEDNVDSFHFHGDPGDYPLTSMILVPRDAKSGTILRGRFLEDNAYQIHQPADVIDGLMQNVFRIKSMLDGVILVVGLATAGAIVLVFSMSLRLRQRELDTITRLGCRRIMIAGLVTAEIVIILCISGILCLWLLYLTRLYSNELIRVLFIG